MPYQLHWDTAAHWDVTLLEEIEATLDELAGGVLLGAELELDGVEGVELLATLPHTSPVMVGISALLLFLLPCTPKLTDCPGWIVLFQLKALAV